MVKNVYPVLITASPVWVVHSTAPVVRLLVIMHLPVLAGMATMRQDLLSVHHVIPNALIVMVHDRINVYTVYPIAIDNFCMGSVYVNQITLRLMVFV